MKNTLREIRKKSFEFSSVDILMPAPHAHDDIELIIVQEGSCEAVCDGKQYSLKKNDFFICFPHQIHYYPSYESGGRFSILILKPSMLMQYESIFVNRIPEKSVIDISDGELDKVLTILKWISDERESDNDDIINLYIILLCGKLLKYIGLKSRTETTDAVSSVIQYCSLNYKNDDISLNLIAKELHLSRSYISYIFNKVLKLNFNNYINSLRMDKAIELLKYSDYSITYISNAVGFGTVRTFNRVFQNLNGVTPTEFKKQYAAKNKLEDK